MQLLDKLPSMLAYWSRDERCLFANHAYREWSDVSAETLATLTLRELAGETAYADVKHLVDGVLAGHTQRFERARPNKDGTVTHWLAYYLPDVRDGVVQGFLAVVTDVTDLHRLREDNERRAQELALLVDLLPVGVSMIDNAGTVFQTNAALRKIMQLAPGSEGAFRQRTFIHADGAPVSPDDLPKSVAIREQRTVGPTEIGMRNADGSTVWVSVTAAPIPSRDAALVVTRDITQERASNEALRQLQKMEAVATFAGGLAHDFNNIMNGILGIAEVMLAEHFGGALSTDLHTIVDAARRGAQLSRQILTLSRPAGFELRPIALGEVAREVTRLLRASAPADIRLDVNESAGLPCALADAGQVHQVLVNLCSNGIQAIGSRAGTLSISLDKWHGAPSPERAETDYVRLTVHDTGDGIPKDVLPRIFDPFFTTKTGAGTGLGLAIVRSIIDAHKGVITVDSVHGESTTFHVYWPATTALPARSTSASAAAKSVLFVDDDTTICKVAERWLTRHGYRVTTFVDPTAAITRFVKEPDAFDVVVTDLSMPNVTGLELARQVLAARPQLAIILTTGNPGELTPEDVRAKGIREILHKPIPLRDLLHAVTRAVAPR